MLKILAVHAKVVPQDVYKSFKSPVQYKLTLLTCTVPNIEDLIEECDKATNDEVLPTLLRNPAYYQ